MKILALDLSLSSTGYSIIDEENNVIMYGVINTIPKDKEFIRIYKIAVKCKELALEYKVDYIICENQFFGTNPKTGLTLSKLLGAVGYIAIESNIPIELITPAQGRKMLMNNGKAKKEEVANFIKENYIDIGEYSDKTIKTKGIQKTSDMYDSMAVGFAFIKKWKLNKDKI